MLRIGLAMAGVATWAALFGTGMLSERVVGTGPVVKQPVKVAEFHGIRVDGSMDVQLTKADAPGVHVEAQANIADLLVTEVKDGIWHIRTRQAYSTEKPFIVHIALPAIDVIQVNGSGDVRSSETFTAKRLHVEVHGSGDVEVGITAEMVRTTMNGSGEIKLTGTTSILEADVVGSGAVKTGGLQADIATVNVTGSGDVTVQAVQKLNATITGSGDVKYKVKPAEIIEQVTGSGEVKPAKE